MLPWGAVTLALGFGTLAPLRTAGAVGLAMLPDYDQRVPGVSHRGPTHTVWFALVVAVVLEALGGLAGRSTEPLAVVASLPSGSPARG